MATRFKILTPLHLLHFQSFPLEDATLLDPTSGSRIYQGEWLKLGTGGTLDRLSAAGATTAMVFPVIDEEGSYDTRALGKVSTVMGSFEFMTQLYDASHTPGSIGAACYVGLITYPAGGSVKRMIIDDNTASGGTVIARVI
ncbi:MAG: hypothetical protein DRJ35_07525, partial [Thermoprotei archaeon]